MATFTLPTNASEYADNETAEGTEVRADLDYIVTTLNSGNLDSTNIDVSANFDWTGRHSWAVSDTSNDNFFFTVSGVLASGKAGLGSTSAAAQVNSALVQHTLSNSSSTVAVEKLTQAGTGYLLQGTLRTLADLNAPFVSAVASSTVSVSNDATETSFTGVAITLPANFLKVGTTIRGKIWGTMDTPGAAPATARIKTKYGTTALLDSGAITPTVSLANSLVVLDFIITCASVGATGTVKSQGTVSWNSNTNLDVRGMGTGATGAGNGSTTTIDTTASTALTTTFTWGSAVADCTFTFHNGYVEVVR